MPISVNHQTSMYLPVNSQMSKTSYRSHCSSSYSYPRYSSSSYSRSSSISDDSGLSITGSSCTRDRSSSQESVLSRLTSKQRNCSTTDNFKSYTPSSSSSAYTRKTTPSSSSRYLADYDLSLPSKYSLPKIDTGRSTSKLSDLSSSRIYSRTHSIQPLSSHRKSTLATTLEQTSGSCEEDGGYLKDRNSPLTKTSSSLSSVTASSAVSGQNGLRNIGNTCFLNTVVQCLSNTSPLKEYLLSDAYVSEINADTRGALIKSFAELIYDLWQGENKVINTTAFKNQVQRFAPRFMGYNQQDAQEFLRYLLEGLHEDVNRVKVKPKDYSQIDDNLSEQQKALESWKRYLRCDNSKIVDLFVGQLKSTLKCTTCGHCSTTYEVFWDLSLPLPSRTGQLRLSQCLEHFTKEEVLDGDEMPTCSKCKVRRKCTKGFTIQKLPIILVLHLKRFSPTERFRKLTAAVDFPLTNLDMSPYTDSSNLETPLYNLYAVSNHNGSTHSGHYTAYCRQPNSDRWHYFNDSRVTNIGPRQIVSNEAYILFYEQNGYRNST